MPHDAGMVSGSGLLLRGIVIAPDGVLDPGEVFIQDELISCVATVCVAEPLPADVRVIETDGVIAPGLIDAHNHLPYNFLPEWVPDPQRLYGNRYQWSEDAQYEAHILPYTAYRSTGTHYCPAAKWAELRSLVHGTTTVMGQSLQQGCIDRLVRNADHYHGLGYDHVRTTIESPREITDADAASYVASFTAADEPTTRFIVHMAEGVVDNDIDLEFASFVGLDRRMNRHRGVSLLAAPDGSFRGTAVFIHSVALIEAELTEALAADAKIVWSPSSNLVLYGETADIGRILELGLTVGLGPDWTLSGEDDMLAEMRFALDWAQTSGVAAIDHERLVTMATRANAVVVGLEDRIGALAPGLRADISVFASGHADPYQAIVESRGRDVRLVLIDGVAYYGDLDLEELAVNGECDMVDACGTPKFLCTRNTPGDDSRAGETVGDVEEQLFNILEGVGYPADEQYGRGDELLPLFDCAG